MMMFVSVWMFVTRPCFEKLELIPADPVAGPIDGPPLGDGTPGSGSVVCPGLRSTKGQNRLLTQCMCFLQMNMVKEEGVYALILHFSALAIHVLVYGRWAAWK